MISFQHWNGIVCMCCVCERERELDSTCVLKSTIQELSNGKKYIPKNQIIQNIESLLL